LTEWETVSKARVFLQPKGEKDATIQELGPVVLDEFKFTTCNPNRKM
jgi:hypothetical protein